MLRYLEIQPRDTTPVQIVTGLPETTLGDRVRPATADVNDARVMPDLTGRTLRDALTRLASLHVGVAIAGQGRVIQQSPGPGESLEPGATARLTLAASHTRARP